MPRDLYQNLDPKAAKTGVSFRKDALQRSERFVYALENSLKQADGLGIRNKSDDSTLSLAAGVAIPSIEDLGASIKQRVVGDVDVQTVPLQIWEGRVLSVNQENRTMEVFLSSTLGGFDAHTGEIDLQWVSDQDKDLVIPGAVFYLTLYKRSKRGTVENSQELRFRRQPNWSKYQLQRIAQTADALAKKMGTPRSL